jgi:hypothetical protein
MHRWIGLCAIGVGLFAPVTQAQTRFEWPADTADVTRYTTAEECLAASERAKQALESWGPVWADTLQLTPERATAPLPAPLVETARRCGARFAAATAPVIDFAPLMELFLLAGRDADAATIVRRRLAAIPATALRERAAVLDSALNGYVTVPFGNPGLTNAQPVRLEAAESLLVDRARVPDTLLGVQDRIRPVWMLLRAARRAGDTARAERVAKRFLELGARLSSAERRTEWGEISRLLTYFALSMQHERALLDSLRHGTAGYVALRRGDWSKATGERGVAFRMPVGQPAATIEGDFWFGAGTPDSGIARSSKGKVALVVFVEHGCIDPSMNCWPAYASLRRLAARFPALAITLVARTRGYFSAMAPPPPEQEANALRQWWQEFHHLPGALAVTSTTFFRLDAPDRRRVDRPTANETHYSFGRTFGADPGMALLVDRNGIVIEVGRLGGGAYDFPDVEEHLAQLIDILLSRPASVS